MIASHSGSSPNTDSFLCPCPHYNARFKMDPNSLEKPTIHEILNTRNVFNMTV